MRHTVAPIIIGASTALLLSTRVGDDMVAFTWLLFSSLSTSWWVVLMAVPVAAIVCIGILVWAENRRTVPAVRKEGGQ